MYLSNIIAQIDILVYYYRMYKARIKVIVDWLFKDSDGRVVVIQPPNTLLSVWIILVVVNHLVDTPSSKVLQSAVLFAWAYIELCEGVSCFRKLLGAIILLVTLFGIYSQ